MTKAKGENSMYGTWAHKQQLPYLPLAVAEVTTIMRNAAVAKIFMAPLSVMLLYRRKNCESGMEDEENKTKTNEGGWKDLIWEMNCERFANLGWRKLEEERGRLERSFVSYGTYLSM